MRDRYFRFAVMLAIFITMATCLSMVCHSYQKACVVNGQEINQKKESGISGHGYRGFVEVENLGDDAGISLLDLQTTHGYQFNPHFYASVGIGFDFGGRKQSKHEVQRMVWL